MMNSMNEGKIDD